MSVRFIIPGRLDGLNTYIWACRANPYKGNKLREENQAICVGEIRKQLRGIHISSLAFLCFSWYEPNRRRDPDNISSFGRKVIQDALVSCGVLKDDGWKYIVGFADHFYIDLENPRIEVEIESVICRAGISHSFEYSKGSDK